MISGSLAGLVLVGFLPWSLMGQEADLDSPLKTIPTSGAEDRNELASELVVMLQAKSTDQGIRAVGAGTIVGFDRDCLYLATADHVARDLRGATQSFANARWSGGPWMAVKVLAPHDAADDLGVLCLGDPGHLFIPFPRIPFFTEGQPARLVSGDTMTFFGYGNSVAWHTKSEPMTYAGISGNVLTVRGGGIEQGDSGGALFRQTDAFNELMGIVLRTSAGETRALSIDRVTQHFRDWKLPVNLEGWNFREANRVASAEADERTLQIGAVSPPNFEQDLERLKRLAVGVSGGPPGRVTGLLVGATDSSIWVQVPWHASGQQPMPRLKLATGLETAVTDISNGAPGDVSILKADVPRKELENLDLVTSSGMISFGSSLALSPLRVPFLPSTALTPGTTAFLIGVDAAGDWQVSPRDLIILRIEPGKVTLSGGSIDPLSIGWIAFDDRNRLIGLVAAVQNTTLDLSPIRDLSAASVPKSASKVESWHPLNLAIQLLAGGADPHCKIARAVGYGRNEEADDVAPTPEGLLIAGRSRMFDYKETEDFTLRLDGQANIIGVSRSRVPGQKGNQRLITDADQKHTFAIGQALVPADSNNPSAEPTWCGFIDEVASTGSPRLVAPLRFCGGMSRFLPDVALNSEDGSIIFAGGKAERDRIVTAASVASVKMDGSVQDLYENKMSIRLGGAARATDGRIYVVGYGTSPAFASHPIVVTKLSPDGTVLWSVSQTDIQDQVVRTTTVMADGAVILAGYVSPVKDPDRRNLRVWKFSSVGTLQWKQDFNVGTSFDVYDMTDDKGGVMIVGSVSLPDSVGNISEDGWLLALGSDGKLEWQQTYSSKYSLHQRIMRFRRVVKTPDGFAILGEIGVPDLGGTVLLLLRLQSEELAVSSTGCGVR